MAEPAAEMTAASLGITQSLTLWTVLMPSFTDIKHASKSDPILVTDIRQTEFMAGGIALLIGAVSSAILKSPIPILATVSTVVVLAVAYEMTLATPPVIETKENEYV